MKCYNAFTGKTLDMPSASTIHQLRNPGRYWIVSDAQLKRDLKGRTLRDIYRENRQGRDALAGKYVPRNQLPHEHLSRDGLGVTQPCLREEYLAWCQARGHQPHPASIDPDHPQNCHREACPKAERISPSKDVLSAVVNRMIADGSPVISAIEA